ncbi:MAG: hypothetical protein ACSLE1_03275 [Sphingobium sp.]
MRGDTPALINPISTLFCGAAQAANAAKDSASDDRVGEMMFMAAFIADAR